MIHLWTYDTTTVRWADEKTGGEAARRKKRAAPLTPTRDEVARIKKIFCYLNQMHQV